MLCPTLPRWCRQQHGLSRGWTLRTRLYATHSFTPGTPVGPMCNGCWQGPPVPRGSLRAAGQDGPVSRSDSLSNDRCGSGSTNIRVQQVSSDRWRVGESARATGYGYKPSARGPHDHTFTLGALDVQFFKRALPSVALPKRQPPARGKRRGLAAQLARADRHASPTALHAHHLHCSCCAGHTAAAACTWGTRMRAKPAAMTLQHLLGRMTKRTRAAASAQLLSAR